MKAGTFEVNEAQMKIKLEVNDSNVHRDSAKFTKIVLVTDHELSSTESIIELMR